MIFMFYPIRGFDIGESLSDSKGIKNGKYGTRLPLINLRIWLAYSATAMLAISLISPIIAYKLFDLNMFKCTLITFAMLGVFSLLYWSYFIANFKATVGDIKHYITYCDCGPFAFQFLGYLVLVAIGALAHDLMFTETISIIIYVVLPTVIASMIITLMVLVWKALSLLVKSIKETK